MEHLFILEVSGALVTLTRLIAGKTSTVKKDTLFLSIYIYRKALYRDFAFYIHSEALRPEYLMNQDGWEYWYFWDAA